MKTFSIISSLIFALFLLTSLKGGDPKKVNQKVPLIKMQNEQAIYELVINCQLKGFKKIKDKDVKIFYFESGTNKFTYHLTYFHKYSGKMENYGAVANDRPWYGDASAKWHNDTTVTVYLFNSAKGDTLKMKMYGNTTYTTQKTNGLLEIEPENE